MKLNVRKIRNGGYPGSEQARGRRPRAGGVLRFVAFCALLIALTMATLFYSPQNGTFGSGPTAAHAAGGNGRDKDDGRENDQGENEQGDDGDRKGDPGKDDRGGDAGDNSGMDASSSSPSDNDPAERLEDWLNGDAQPSVVENAARPNGPAPIILRTLNSEEEAAAIAGGWRN